MAVTVRSMKTPAWSGAYHVAGTTETGPLNTAVWIGSMHDYHRVYGTRTPTAAALYDDLHMFFTEGGWGAYITRVPDTATAAEHVTALDATATDLRGLAVAVPAHTAETIGPALITHAATTGRIALLTPDHTATAQDTAALAADLAQQADADHAGLFYPWVRRGAAALPPTGYVAAARSRVHERTGYWAHPAGSGSTARSVSGLVAPTDRAQAWDLADQLVSALAVTPTGVQVYGWWSLAGDRPNFAHLSTRDLLNNIAAQLSVHFSVIGETKWATVERTYAHIRAAARSVLSELAAAGGLVRTTPDGGVDAGYRVSLAINDERTAVDVQVDVRPPQYARLVGALLYRIPLSVPIPGSVL